MSLYARNDIVVKIMMPYGLSWHRHHPKTYQDLTIFLEARVGDIPHVIYTVVSGGVYCPCVAAYTLNRQHPKPHPTIGDHSGMKVRANAAASPVRGSICLASPEMGRFWGGSYIYWRIFGTLPLARLPLGTSYQWWMVVRFALSFGEASSWTAATLPPAKWWKYEGLELN